MNEKLKEINEIISACEKLVHFIEANGTVRTGNSEYEHYKSLINRFDSKHNLENNTNLSVRVNRDVITKYYFTGGRYSVDLYEANVILNAVRSIKHSMFPNEFEKIFISHSSNDKKQVGDFASLLYAIGIPRPLESDSSDDKVIFCSSLPESYIEIGKNFSNEIQMQFNSHKHILYILWYSDNYFKSQPCLNEAGAVWVRNNKYISVLAPGFKREKIKMLLDDRCIDVDAINTSRLNELKKTIENGFNLPSVDINYWESARKDFIDSIKT